MRSGTLLTLLLLVSLAFASPLDKRVVDRGRPARLIVGSAPSGAADVLARLIAHHLKNTLDVDVIVENRTGGGGRVAAEYVKGAEPDGLTLLLADTGLMVTSALTHRLIRFDPLADFSAVARVASRYEAIAVSAGRSAAYGRDLRQWLQAAGRDESNATYGVPAVGSLSQFIGYRLGREHGVVLLPVPYRGSILLANDLVGDRIAAGILPVADVLPFYRAGRLQVLAVNGARRTSLLPDVPTLDELGFRHFDSLEWYGIFLPRDAPAEVVDRWHDALVKVLALGELNGRLLKIGLHVDPGTPRALAAQLAGDLANWRPIVRAAGW